MYVPYILLLIASFLGLRLKGIKLSWPVIKQGSGSTQCKKLTGSGPSA
jgi:hypothetical protein